MLRMCILTGEKCELVCQNGGTLEKSCSCSCLPKYTGKECESELLHLHRPHKRHMKWSERQRLELHMVRKEGRREKWQWTGPALATSRSLVGPYTPMWVGSSQEPPLKYIRREWISGCWRWPVTWLLKGRLQIWSLPVLVQCIAISFPPSFLTMCSSERHLSL